MKKTLLFTKGAIVAFLLFYSLSFSQLFNQNFNSSSTLSHYVNSTNPTNEQFNSISTTGDGVAVNINDHQLRFTRTGTNSASFSRTTNFYPTPTSLIYQFDITVSGNNLEQTTAAVWQVGSEFGKTNSVENNDKTHSKIGLNITSVLGQFSLRSIGTGTNSTTFSGKQTVLWYINNSGSSLTYIAPDFTTQTVANDRFDIWIGTLKVFRDIPATTGTIDLKNLKFVFTGGAAIIDIDNISVNPFPTEIPSLATGGIGILPEFIYNEGSGPSSSQYFTVSGSNLNPASGSIIVTPPPSYEISTDNINYTSSNLLIPYSSGSLPESLLQKIYVRLKSGLIAGIYSNENIIISGGGAESLNVICNGMIMKPTVDLGSLSSTIMNYPLGAGPSPSTGISITGTNLSGNVTVSTNDITKWQVSRDNVVWESSVMLAPVGGVLSSGNNRIYVRLKAELDVGVYSGILTASAPNAINKTVAISGEVLRPNILINSLPQNISLSGFSYHGAQGPSSVQSFVVNGSGLSDNIVSVASENWEISSNAAYNGSNNSPFSTVIFTKNSNHQVSSRSLYIRLKDGLTAGIYNGTITISSSNAETRIVKVFGEVLPSKVDMRVLGGNATITSGSSVPSSLNRTLFAAQRLGDSQIKTYTIINYGGEKLVLGEIILNGSNTIDFTLENAPKFNKEVLQGESVTFDIKFAPTTVGQKFATVNIFNNDPSKNPYKFTIAGNANFCGASSEIIIAQQGFEEIPANIDWSYGSANIEMYGVRTGFSVGKSTTADSPSGNNLFAEGLRGFRIQGAKTNPLLTPFLLDFAEIDTSIYSNINLSVRVAGFSIGSTANGIDPYDSNGANAITELEKIDFVLIEVSPDGGLTWYQQAKVVSDEPDLTWSFGSTGIVSGSREYKTNNDLTYFKSNTAKKYSTIIINNLPSVSNLKIRISAQNNNEFESWILDDIKLLSTGIVPKVWNGSSWSPSPPANSDKVLLNGDYKTEDFGSLQVCQCEINNATLTIASNDFFVVSDQLVNNGHIIVESDGNFVQVNEVNSNAGTGTFTVNRNSNLKRLDYTYWSSPVSGQNLKNFSPGTVNSRFYTYNEGTDLFESIDPISNVFGNSRSGFESPAKGYAIRANNNYINGISQIFSGVFKGVANNAAIIFPLQFQSLPGGTGFNLVGNPYSSNIDFYKLADDNRNQISKTAYFWTNLNPTPAMQGSNYPGEGYFNNYAILNGTGGIPATLGESIVKSDVPTRTIKVGQGFIVQAKRSTDLTFNNAHRTKNTASVFFNKSEQEIVMPIDRYWLHLTTPLKVTTTALIGYVEEASNEFDIDYDAPLFGLGADALFSQLDDYKLGIQGRALPFTKEDKVKIGSNHYVSGVYVISLGNTEGIFANGQDIFLKDNSDNTVTNLKHKNYTFVANKGLSEGRFEILYRQDSILDVENSIKDDLVIYRDGSDFIIKSERKSISVIEVYDASGRLVLRSSPNKFNFVLSGSTLMEGVYYLNITREGQVRTRKIVI